MAKNIADIMAYEPSEGLNFEGPFNKSIKRTLVIRSLVGKDMVYKVKTTSPRLFFVRPNIGILPAESSVTIEIHMEPSMSLVADPFKKHHKFLIVASEATEDIGDLPEFFKDLDPDKMWEGRVRCELVLPKQEINDDSLANNLDETIRQTAGRIATEDVDRTYNVLSGNDLENMTLLQDRIATLEKARLDLTEEIKNLRNTEGGLLGRRYPSLFALSAAFVTIGAVIFFGTFGKALLQQIKQAF